LIRVLRGVFPDLNLWLNQLPDPRVQAMCRYTAAHVWWHILAMFMARSGSRNAYDEHRQNGQAAWNMGEVCGQAADAVVFDGHPGVTGSDNAAHHAARVDPEAVAYVVVQMLKVLLGRRFFDEARLFGHDYVLLVDGSLREKCRAGFGQGGKSGTGVALYRYVLQVVLVGPDGTAFPLMHEHMDLEDPERQKEDCELACFRRLATRLKAEFPKRSFCLVGDALYGCQPIITLCEQYDWKYVLTLKEGRQPTTWSEVLHLLPLHHANRVRLGLGQDGEEGRQDSCWLQDVLLGSTHTNVILSGEITSEAATLYAFVTNYPRLSAERVLVIANCAGRERHCIEDTFNTQKNHGMAMEHVFCAQAAASKNYYSMMQIAHILWILTYQGCLRRLYDWARRTTQQGLARMLWEGMRAVRLPPDLAPLGQLRFGFL